MMKRLLLAILLLGTGAASGQNGAGTGEESRIGTYRSKWRTFGMTLDCLDAQIGLSFSNGYDEFPLIHFEDFSSKVAYKISALSDYKEEYGLHGSIGWVYPFRHVSMLSLNAAYDHGVIAGLRNIGKIGIEGRFYVKPLDMDIILEPAYRYFNGNNNFGASLGLQKVLFRPYLYAGISGGYFGDYWTYSAYIQTLLFRNMIGLRISYDKVKRADFVKIGLSYVLNRAGYRK